VTNPGQVPNKRPDFESYLKLVYDFMVEEAKSGVEK
jgi:hypothetical protein